VAVGLAIEESARLRVVGERGAKVVRHLDGPRPLIRLDLDVKDVCGIDACCGTDGAADRDLRDPVHRPDRAGVCVAVDPEAHRGSFASAEAIHYLRWDDDAGGSLSVKLQLGAKSDHQTISWRSGSPTAPTRRLRNPQSANRTSLMTALR
jgi:hypothetical protein